MGDRLQILTPESMTPQLRDLMENPPPTVLTPAIEYLATLEPWGIWRAPLTDGQIAAARTFGERFFFSNTPMANNPYLLQFHDSRVMILLKTAFAAIAEYVGREVSAGGQPNVDDITNINTVLSHFNNDFLMKIMSPYKFVSIVHIRRDYRIQSMENITKGKYGTMQTIDFTFPFPQTDEFGVQLFEYFVPKQGFFGGGREFRVGFTFDFGTLH
jgi:hypothetical protein